MGLIGLLADVIVAFASILKSTGHFIEKGANRFEKYWTRSKRMEDDIDNLKWEIRRMRKAHKKGNKSQKTKKNKSQKSNL